MAAGHGWAAGRAVGSYFGHDLGVTESLPLEDPRDALIREQAALIAGLSAQVTDLSAQIAELTGLVRELREQLDAARRAASRNFVFESGCVRVMTVPTSRYVPTGWYSVNRKLSGRSEDVYALARARVLARRHARHVAPRPPGRRVGVVRPGRAGRLPVPAGG